MYSDTYWNSVNRTDDPEACWEWKGTRWSNDYGRLSIDGVETTAHRRAWILINGPIPKGMCICHTCDNPPCCNPHHLRCWTPQQNSADMMEKGRHNPAMGERNSHAKLTEKTVILIHDLYHADPENFVAEDHAQKHGVAVATIWSVVFEWSWRHLWEGVA